MELYIIAAAGLLLHWLIVLDSAMRKSDFEWGYFFRENMANMAIGIVTTALVIYGKDEFAQWFVVGKISALFVGYLSGDIFHRLLKLFRERAKKIE